MIAIANTDLDWFELLSMEPPESKINFWTPTGWNVGKLEKGDRLYFLLKAPIRKIGGYGHYSYFEKMTPREAWDTFGKGNGVYDLTELVAKTSGYAAHHSTKFDPNEDREIGCIVLDRPVFFEEDGFFDPNDSGRIVRYGIRPAPSLLVRGGVARSLRARRAARLLRARKRPSHRRPSPVPLLRASSNDSSPSAERTAALVWS
jgi:putative restriction endonuclease